MKTIRFNLVMACLIWLCYQEASAANYYFSSQVGDDNRTAAQAQNPNTPWRSIDKLNQIFSTLKPGDVVYLRRGDVFYGTINVSVSGTAANPIKISSYGSGELPVVTSLVSISGWKSVGQGRFESNSPFSVNKVAIVLIDGKLQEQGRFPNKGQENGGYLTISKVNGKRSFSSTELSSGTNFTGGEVVIRKVPWVTDRHPITSHNGNSVNMGDPIDYYGNTSFDPNKDWGFFIQNHLQTLDVYGEWFFNGNNKKLYVHGGAANLNHLKVEVATLNHLLTKAPKAQFVTIEKVHFNGANSDAVFLDSGTGFKLIDIKVTNSGGSAIHAMGCKNLEISDSKISDALTNGIFLRWGSTGAKITGSTVENIGPFQGGMPSGELSGIGICANDNYVDILNNTVLNTAYSGIFFRNSYVNVKNNYINGFCIHKTDGGGVYTFGGASGTETHYNRVISHNIILNGPGTFDGTPRQNDTPLSGSRPLANGIFLDDNTTNVQIRNNTIAHATNAGIQMSGNNGVTIEDNVIFDNGVQISMGNYPRGRDPRNNTLRRNTFFVNAPTQDAYALRSYKNDIGSFGTYDQNVFLRPLGDDQTIVLAYPKGNEQVNETMDLNKWSATYNKDRSSKNSPVKLPAFQYIKSIGQPLYAHGDFERNLVGVNCWECQVSKVTGKINGSSLQVTDKGPSSNRLIIGGVTANKDYVLKFKALANKSGKLRIYLRHSGSPWEPLTSSTTVDLSNKVEEYSVLLRTLVTAKDVSLMFVADIGNWTYWIDDVEISEAVVKITDPIYVILFEYNNTSNKKSIPLSGKYVDAHNKVYSGSVEIAPFSSVLLIRTEAGEEKASSKPAPSVTLTKLAASQGLTEADEVSFIAEANSQASGIKNIDVFVNGKVLGSSDQSPSHFTLKDLRAGNYEVCAKASDGSGLAGYSDTLRFQVAKVIESLPEVSLPSTSFSKFINLGSNNEVKYQSNDFEAENKSGVSVRNAGTFTNTGASSHTLFHTERSGQNVSLSLPVQNGKYQVITYHNELWFGHQGPSAAKGRRVFDIAIENVNVKSRFDLFEHSSNQPTALVFDGVTVNDGKLDVNLKALANNATISGIAIIRIDGKVEEKPIVTDRFSLHLNAGEVTSVEKDGITFVGETTGQQFYSSGSSTFRHVAPNTNPLFNTERNANHLQYAINVPNGVYQVTTYHNELWFGKNGPASQAGRRVFDVSIEGVKVKENFDIFVASKNQPTQLVFENIVVNDGVLNLDLRARANNASVSGISIVSQSALVPVPQPTPDMFSLMLNTGGLADVSLDGLTFLGNDKDASFIVGNSGKFSYPQSGVSELFHTERNGQTIRLNIPVPNGNYTLQTFHNELWFGKNGPSGQAKRRVFDISLEGKVARSSIDLFVENGNNPVVFTFKNVVVSDGVLSIELKASVNNATLSGLALFSGTAANPNGRATLRGYREMEVVDFGLVAEEQQISSPKTANIYPNPARDVVNIELNQESSPLHILIHDLSGRLVQLINNPAEARTNNTYTVRLSQIPQGVYLVSVINSDQSKTQQRLIVQP